MPEQLTFHFTEPGAIDFESPKFRQEFERTLTELDEKLQPIIDALEASEQLTERDFSLWFCPFS